VRHQQYHLKVGDVNIINLEEPSIKMRSVIDHAKITSLVTDSKMNIGNGMTVTKLSRKSTTSQSRRS
jgi:hypothetical protein